MEACRSPQFLLAIFFSLAAYTVSGSAQAYWQLAPISLYGQLIFFLVAVSCISFLFLLSLALYLRDFKVLLPHNARRQRRVFCFTCCPCGEGAGGDADDDAALPSAFSVFPLRWTHVSQTELLLLLGINNATASLLQWYASPPGREPPLINGLVPTLQAFFAVPLSYYALGDARKFIRGGGWTPYLAALCVSVGVAVSVVPSQGALAPPGGAETGTDVVLWTLLNVVSQVPSAMALVGAQAYLLRAGVMEEGAPAMRRLVALSRFVLYNQAGVGLVVGACWWLDILPWFGSSHLDSWWSGLHFSFLCSLGYHGGGEGAGSSACPAGTPFWAALTVLPYALYLGGIALVSGSSAVFGNVLEVGQSALQTLVWMLPGVNPAPLDTPLWSAMVAFLLTLVGVALLRVWEAKQEEPSVTADGLAPIFDASHWWAQKDRQAPEDDTSTSEVLLLN